MIDFQKIQKILRGAALAAIGAAIAVLVDSTGALGDDCGPTCAILSAVGAVAANAARQYLGITVLPLIMVCCLAGCGGCVTAPDARVQYMGDGETMQPLMEGEAAPAAGWVVPSSVIAQKLPWLVIQDELRKEGREAARVSPGDRVPEKGWFVPERAGLEPVSMEVLPDVDDVGGRYRWLVEGGDGDPWADTHTGWRPVRPIAPVCARPVCGPD